MAPPCLSPGTWTALVINEDPELQLVPDGLTISGDPWNLDNSDWLSANSAGISEFTVAGSVPSLSPTGAALLGGLVFAIAVAGLAVQRRRRSL